MCVLKRGSSVCGLNFKLIFTHSVRGQRKTEIKFYINRKIEKKKFLIKINNLYVGGRPN